MTREEGNIIGGMCVMFFWLMGLITGILATRFRYRRLMRTFRPAVDMNVTYRAQFEARPTERRVIDARVINPSPEYQAPRYPRLEGRGDE